MIEDVMSKVHSISESMVVEEPYEVANENYKYIEGEE